MQVKRPGRSTAARGTGRRTTVRPSKARKTGRGILSDIVDKVKQLFFFPPNKLPGDSQRVFDAHKSEVITAITVGRFPIKNYINKVVDTLSGGAWKAALRKLGYDKMFHLFIVVHTDKSTLKIEKNERINITTSLGQKTDLEITSAPWNKANITLDKFLENARKSMGDHRFFQYNAFENNCQDFILGLLRANGAASASVVKFIKQDTISLMEQLRYFIRRVSQFATDTAGKIKQLTTGQIGRAHV